MEIGIDVLDIDRMLKLVDKITFLNKYYSQNEIDYLCTLDTQNRAKVMAGYYSCKEAFLKALGLGIGRGIDLKDISVEYSDMGKPFIVLSKKAKKIFNDFGFKKISVNITDSKQITVAVCLVY